MASVIDFSRVADAALPRIGHAPVQAAAVAGIDRHHQRARVGRDRRCCRSPAPAMTWPMGPWLASADGLAVTAVPEAVGEGVGGPPQATRTAGSSQASSSLLR